MFARRSWTVLLILALPFTNISSAEDRAAAAKQSRAWYILSQPDADGMLHGLPERLAAAVASEARPGNGAKTAPATGRLMVDVEIDGTADGEVVLGFFADPRWWIADPIDVRRVAGRGKHLLEGLHSGNFVIGAMLGGLPRPRALGVHQSWPAAIPVTASQTGEVRVRVSSEFKNRTGLRRATRATRNARQQPGPAPLPTVHVVDENQRPLPFAQITFVERDQNNARVVSYERVTDVNGKATCDQISGSFSLRANRSEFVPATMASCGLSCRLDSLHSVSDSTPVEVVLGPMPVGTGRLSGRVHDQYGKPLTEFFISLSGQISGEQRGALMKDVRLGMRVPVTNPDGRYEIRDLPAGAYRVKVRHFDYPTHVWSRNGIQITIPEGQEHVAKLDVELEVKEL